jgi:hypothetical protein
MPQTGEATFNSQFVILLPGRWPAGRTHEDAIKTSLAANQATAHRYGLRPFVFTLLPTKCTDGVGADIEVMPAPWPLEWGGTRAGGLARVFLLTQYAFDPHGNN